MKIRNCGRIAIIIAVMTAVLAGCGKEKAAQEEGPVAISFWHYYNDAQKEGLDEIIAQYNATEGKEKQITVTGVGLGSIEDITTKVESALSGSESELERPNMFLAYRDVLQEIRKESPDALLDFQQYFTEDALDNYYPDFLEEGRFGKALYIMPVTKSTELLFMNQTMLDQFFAENPEYSTEQLATWETMEQMAERFYQWTDDKTPETAGDGKALIGLDNFSNYFIAQNAALGSSIYETLSDGSVEFDLQKEYIDRLFLNYYIPYTKGYYGGKEKYRSDDLRQDTLYGYVGSVASVTYFPETVYGADGSETEITMGIYPYPCFSDGEKTAIQQGAGIAALEGTERENQAVADFIKWISEEKGIEYASMISYMPTSKGSIEKGGLEVIENENLRAAVETGMEQVKNYRMARGFDFEGAYGVRMDLEDYFKSFLQKGRAEYVSYLEEGRTPAEAEEAMQYAAKADAFYEEITHIFYD